MEMISVENLNSVKTVIETMAANNLPKLSQDALIAISKLEGHSFKKALVAINNKNDPNDVNRIYVNVVTALLTSARQALLVSLGYQVELEILIKISKEHARQFINHLQQAARGDTISQKWLDDTLSLYGYRKPAKTPQIANFEHNGSRGVGQFVDNPEYPEAENDEDFVKKGNKSTTEFESTTFYGNKHALCFNAVSNDKLHSLIIDAGNRLETAPEGSKKINWKEKVIFGCTFEEMIEMAWVLLGLNESCKFSGHGASHDKSFELKRQPKGFYAAVSAKDKGIRGVPLSQASGLRLQLLIMLQMSKNYPSMSVQELLGMLKISHRPNISEPVQHAVNS